MCVLLFKRGPTHSLCLCALGASAGGVTQNEERCFFFFAFLLVVESIRSHNQHRAYCDIYGLFPVCVAALGFEPTSQTRKGLNLSATTVECEEQPGIDDHTTHPMLLKVEKQQ